MPRIANATSIQIGKKNAQQLIDEEKIIIASEREMAMSERNKFFEVNYHHCSKQDQVMANKCNSRD